MASARDGPRAPKAELLPYDALFPPGEAHRATERVLAEISDHQKHLDRLRLYAADNTDLLNLVRTLPDDLSHDIMVPFGKAAFFPGCIVHTNEFLVLLGEGYYAEQTAKQTAGVLKRRGEVLAEKMDALKAMIADLKARAEFFGATAGESVEGIVEIREFEEPSQDNKDDAGVIDSGSRGSSKEATITDEEYSKILEGLDKLEREELAAQGIASDEDKSAASKSVTKIDSHYQKNTMLQKPKISESAQMELSTTDRGETSGIRLEPSISAQTSLENPNLQSSDLSYRHEIPDKRCFDRELGNQDDPYLKPLGTDQSFPLAFTPKDNIKKEQVPKDKEPVTGAFTTSYSQRKAFTGTIVEHGDGLDPKPSSSGSSQATASKASRPVSRFKMQKGR